ncbi:MAG: 2OG-Fe(II) oxygenase [Burkholderiales bacterium]|nr:2OG-Fe(II) oxygenase [Burkholderiales bacterium]
MQVVDDAWRAWIEENTARGCTHASMVDAMVRAGFEPGFAWATIQGGTAPVSNVAAYHYDPMPVSEHNLIDVGDREVRVLMRMAQPQLVVMANVLSNEECDEIIERSRAKLERSTTVNPLTGVHDVISKRTSEGTFFPRCEDEFIARLDHRIARLMNWPLENGEGLQILRYGVGGEYRPHFDYFPPQEPGSATHLARGGQRVATLIVYLSDAVEGGETIFPDVHVSVAPRKGGAVYFRYTNQAGQLDPLSLHGGAPVLAGEKWIMTKWMRERPYA